MKKIEQKILFFDFFRRSVQKKPYLQIKNIKVKFLKFTSGSSTDKHKNIRTGRYQPFLARKRMKRILLTTTLFYSSLLAAPTINDFCLQKPTNKICNLDALTASWFFDSKDNTCKMFIDGGCQEANNFSSIKGCMVGCGDDKTDVKYEVVERSYLEEGSDSEEQDQEEQEVQDILPVISIEEVNDQNKSNLSATNIDVLPKIEEDRIEKEANEDEAETEAEIEKTEFQIQTKPEIPTESETKPEKSIFCNTPYRQGRCRGAFLSYGYNAKTNQCDVFLFGGCAMNENVFTLSEDCIKACGDEDTTVNMETNSRYLENMIEEMRRLREEAEKAVTEAPGLLPK